MRYTKFAFLTILYLLVSFPSLTAQSQEAARPVETYDQLISAIRETMRESRERLEAAVEREKVRETWEIGKLIDEHILHYKERADYGEQVLKRLSADLGTSHTELKYMVQFARSYPIGPAPDQLSWAHYRELLSINEPEIREELAQRAKNENWGSRDLRREIQRLQRPQGQVLPTRKLEAQPGEAGTYRVVRAEGGAYAGKLLLDLGFSTYFYPGNPFEFKEGDIVRGQARGLQILESATEADLYTYPVSIKEVLDGDTFKAFIDLGFGMTTVQKLRLRGLDAREIESAEGREAKEFLEKALGGGEVVIRTVKSDKYDRYLADVFVGKRYINQELVEQGLATVVEEV